MEENIKLIILIASELESFKLKVYTLLNKEKWLDDFIMNNAPCNYKIMRLKDIDTYLLFLDTGVDKPFPLFKKFGIKDDVNCIVLLFDTKKLEI